MLFQRHLLRRLLSDDVARQRDRHDRRFDDGPASVGGRKDIQRRHHPLRLPRALYPPDT